MKTIQKIAAILYSIWAIYRSYILIQAVIYSTSTVTTKGVQYFSRFNVFYVLILLVPSLSLITSSIFIVLNSFVKKYSLKREICSIAWLGVNIGFLNIIPPMTYLIPESIVTEKIQILLGFYTDKTTLIISIILSKYVLIAFALFNIIINSLKIGGVGREKI